MPTKAVGFSNSFIKKKCSNCENTKMQIVQTQDYLFSTDKIHFFGIGERKFAISCSNCEKLSDMTESQEKKAATLKFALSNSSYDNLTLRNEATKSKSYSVLNSKRREAIRKSNKKEGAISLTIGIIIGVIVTLLPFDTWNQYVGIIIIVYSILGGLYGILEDPERKHREYIDNNVKL